MRPVIVRTVLVCGLASPRAMAAPSSQPAPGPDEPTAQALFDEAKDLMARGQFDRACPRLEESQRLDSAVGTLLNLADCYEKTNRLASAWSTFLEAASAAREARQPDREQAAKERATEIEPRLARLVVHVIAEARVPGLTVVRDGHPVGELQFDLPIPTDAGAHTMAASAPGRRPWQERIVVGGEATVMTVTVPPLMEDPTAPRRAPSFFSPLGAQKALALVAAGVALGGLAFGAGFAISAKSENDQANAVCPAVACSNLEAVTKSDDAVRDGHLATAAFVAAGAMVAAGAVLWFTAKPGVGASPAGATAKVGVGLGGLQLRGAW
jgi:hypothetical protein